MRLGCVGKSPAKNAWYPAPIATRKKTLSLQTSHKAREAVSSNMRSVLLSAKAACPPSSTHTGIKFKIFNQAPARASAAHSASPVCHQRTAHTSDAISPANGPARLIAARVSGETPSARQRTYAPKPGKNTGISAGSPRRGVPTLRNAPGRGIGRTPVLQAQVRVRNACSFESVQE